MAIGGFEQSPRHGPGVPLPPSRIKLRAKLWPKLADHSPICFASLFQNENEDPASEDERSSGRRVSCPSESLYARTSVR